MSYFYSLNLTFQFVCSVGRQQPKALRRVFGASSPAYLAVFSTPFGRQSTFCTSQEVIRKLHFAHFVWISRWLLSESAQVLVAPIFHRRNELIPVFIKPPVDSW